MLSNLTALLCLAAVAGCFIRFLRDGTIAPSVAWASRFAARTSINGIPMEVPDAR